MSGPVEISDIFGGYPGFVPGILLAAVAGLLASGPIGRWLDAPRVLAWALVASLGMVLAATLTPSPSGLQRIIAGAGPLEHYRSTCDFSRMGPAPIGEYLSVGDVSLNVLLFVPLGAAIGLLPRSRPKAAILLGALALPVAVEAIQLAAVPLDRACQSGDVFDNAAGVLLGLVVGGAAGRLVGLGARIRAANPQDGRGGLS